VLSGRRDASYLRLQWAKLAAKFETAHNRYSQSGVNQERFCLCGAPGFYPFSGWTSAFAKVVAGPRQLRCLWQEVLQGFAKCRAYDRTRCGTPLGHRRRAGGAGGGGYGGKNRRKEKKLPHDQSDTTFKDDTDGRVNSRKQDMLGDVLELLRNSEEGGGRTRETSLQALVIQQNTMENTSVSLMNQTRMLKAEMAEMEFTR